MVVLGARWDGDESSRVAFHVALLFSLYLVHRVTFSHLQAAGCLLYPGESS